MKAEDQNLINALKEFKTAAQNLTQAWDKARDANEEQEDKFLLAMSELFPVDLHCSFDEFTIDAGKWVENAINELSKL